MVIAVSTAWGWQPGSARCPVWRGQNGRFTKRAWGHWNEKKRIYPDLSIYGSFMVAKLTNMYNYNAVTFIGLMVIGTLVKLVVSDLQLGKIAPIFAPRQNSANIPRYVMICVHGNFWIHNPQRECGRGNTIKLQSSRIEDGHGLAIIPWLENKHMDLWINHNDNQIMIHNDRYQSGVINRFMDPIWFKHIIWLVVYQPLWKNILVSWDFYSQYMKNKKCSKPPTSNKFTDLK